MRRFLSFTISLLYTAVFIGSPLVSAQGTNNGDATAPAFELIVPATARANEAFDVTVKALNSDGTTNTTYTGSISFSVSPLGSGATVPANIDDIPTSSCADGSTTDDNNRVGEYCFRLDAQGQHTFAKAFVFPKDGSYEITVMDNESFTEVLKPITITAGGTTTTENATVTITDPVSQDTVNASTIVVAGTTKPTSTVNFFLGSDKK